CRWPTMSGDPFGFDEAIDRRQVPALKVHPLVLGPDGGNLFPAGVADMDFCLAPQVRAALQARLDHRVFGYETLQPGLIPALTAWMEQRHGWQIDRTHILRAPNVLNALAMAVNLFSDPGAKVIVQPPVFFDFFDILKENGREAVLNPLVLRDGRYEVDFEDLERRASDPGTQILLLCNPHNPVGRVWQEQELRRLGEICLRHGVLVISDEIHCDLAFVGHRYRPFASLGRGFSENSITCLSPAKSFNIAACCAAFTVIPDEGRRQAMLEANSRLTVNKNNAFANVAMEAAYTSGGPWLEAALAYIQGNLALVQQKLPDLPGVQLIEPEGTFLLWLDFRALDLDPTDLTGFLRQKAGWGVTRGRAFGAEGRGFARVNIACRRADLKQALDQLQIALRTLA
ncbi:PatB family C-S lyase, partial [Pseudophaeobacter sp.]|uniref:MalY/PatB family protein n=1 Tax=Pseudophaeobacter sp. TaxID=1971739 RepID=UPI003299DBD0